MSTQNFLLKKNTDHIFAYWNKIKLIAMNKY
jgi:hypothetical protein